MKCEYENAVHKIIELARVIDKRKTALWVNGNLDKKVKGRLLTIGKILNQDADAGDKNCNLQNASQQRELLIEFARERQGCGALDSKYMSPRQHVDDFLGNL